jgi:phage terminase small subunit
VLTPKQEHFAQKYLETGNASEAYRQAYSTKGKSENYIHVQACELLKSRKVSVRVEELKEQHRERHQLTVDDLISELEESRQAAMTAKSPQTSAAVSATMGKARILGLDKQVLEHQNKSVEVVVNRPNGD